MATVAKLTRNAEVLAESTRAFQRRDFDAAVQNMADDVTFTDHAQGKTVRGRDQYLQWVRDWLSAFSDAQPVNITYFDAGDAVIELYNIRGTNDGPLGPFPATGRSLESPRTCEIWRFNEKGQLASGEIYYDQLSILVQLGHIEPPTGG